MLSHIPKTRLILYLMIAGLLPLVFVAMNFLSKKRAMEELEQSLYHMQQLAYNQESKQAVNLAVQEHYKHSDHFYIDKHLETLSFLELEVEMLEKLVNDKYFAGGEAIKNRLDFLTGSGNTLLFSEGNVQAYPSFQEITADLVHPVEVNAADLKEILSLVEGEAIGLFKPGPNRPQLIILDLKLDKKKSYENNEVFLLNMKLLKREFS